MCISSVKTNLLTILFLFLAPLYHADASPHYSRAYKMSCSGCHDQGSRLNTLGYRFQETGRLDHWQEDSTLETGDKRISLPDYLPLSIYARLGFYYRQNRSLSDPASNSASRQSSFDFQGPEVIRLLASAPLSRRTGFQLDLDIKPGEKNVEIGNAWVRSGHDSHFRFSIGRFDLAQMLINPRTQLHARRPAIYTTSQIGFDHGLKLEIDIGFSTLVLGAANGISEPLAINSSGPGYTGVSYDYNSNKRFFGLFNLGITEQYLGIFGSIQTDASATGTYAEILDGPAEERIAAGIQGQKKLGQRIRLAVQLLGNQWENFLGDNSKYRWYGGFVNLELLSVKGYGWTLLYEYTNAGSFSNSGTIWEGLAQHTITNTLSWQQMLNLRYRLDFIIDLQPELNSAPYTRHSDKQNGIFAGIEFSI